MHLTYHSSRDRIVVSTLRCGRNNPGSNPGHGKMFFNSTAGKPLKIYIKVFQQN